VFAEGPRAGRLRGQGDDTSLDRKRGLRDGIAVYAIPRSAVVRRRQGQVRGVQHMIEDDRYCLYVVQQLNAVTAAAREVALIVLEDHLRGCVREAVKENGGEAARRRWSPYWARPCASKGYECMR
jgi:DNA-binding FrmR family transcriptional regulator